MKRGAQDVVEELSFDTTLKVLPPRRQIARVQSNGALARLYHSNSIFCISFPQLINAAKHCGEMTGWKLKTKTHGDIDEIRKFRREYLTFRSIASPFVAHMRKLAIA